MNIILKELEKFINHAVTKIEGNCIILIMVILLK